MSLPIAPARPVRSSAAPLPDSPLGEVRRLPARPVANLGTTTAPVNLDASHDRPALARVEAPRKNREVPADILSFADNYGDDFEDASDAWMTDIFAENNSGADDVADADADAPVEVVDGPGFDALMEAELDERLAEMRKAVGSTSGESIFKDEGDDLDLIQRDLDEAAARVAAEEAERAAAEEHAFSRWLKSERVWSRTGGIIGGVLTIVAIAGGAYASGAFDGFLHPAPVIVETTAPATGPQIKVDLSTLPAATPVAAPVVEAPNAGE